MLQLIRKLAKESGRARAGRIVKTYREFVALSNEFASMVYADVCGPCIGDGGKRGIGCCTVGDNVYGYIHGPAKKRLTALWSEASTEAEGNGRQAGECLYHSGSAGCLIKDLKPPLCASYYCSGARGRLLETYGIEWRSGLISRPLEEILSDERLDRGQLVLATARGVNPAALDALRDYLEWVKEAVRSRRPASGRECPASLRRQPEAPLISVR